jgi:hypothetical protein
MAIDLTLINELPGVCRALDKSAQPPDIPAA